MHARWLVDSAALLAYHAPMFEQTRSPLPNRAVYKYWTMSRQRFNLWNQALGEHRVALEEAGPSYRGWIWKNLQSVIEEVFLSDVLVRVMSGLATKLELLEIDPDSAAIVASTMSGQEECRNRCMHLINDGLGLSVELNVKLNRIRYSLENWTDTLLSTLDSHPEVLAFCFKQLVEPDLAPEVSLEKSALNRRRIRWQFMMSGCQQWINNNCISIPACPEENRAIHQAAYTLLQPEWMDVIQFEDSGDISSCEKLVMSLQGMVQEAKN